MNRLPYFLIALTVAVGFGCETVIQTKLDTGPAQLSVDGLLTDQPGPQRIRLTQTAAYFDNGPAPVASGATVTVTDNAGKIYSFTGPDNAGYYVWMPKAGDTLGRIGRSYTLTISYQNQTYTARSALNRVPPVDSIIFRRQRITPVSKDYGYQSEFYARDIAGAPDYYRIRYYKNDTLQNRPADIITVYDASFSNNANTDGLLFIQPLRQSANPAKFYSLNDSVRIEILSLTADAYDFLRELRTQLTNTGLFARPATNVPTNLVNTNPSGPTATGYFMTCAVRGRTTRVSNETLRP